MTDRRLTPANGRAALASLRGVVDAPRYAAGEAARVSVPLADLNRAPDGPRDRQLLLGDAVTVIDRHQGWAFVQAAKDGYCGYVPETALGAARLATHRVIAPATHLYPQPKVQAHELCALSFGSLLTVTGTAERFAETADGFVPFQHLRVLADPLPDHWFDSGFIGDTGPAGLRPDAWQALAAGQTGDPAAIASRQPPR